MTPLGCVCVGILSTPSIRLTNKVQEQRGAPAGNWSGPGFKSLLLEYSNEYKMYVNAILATSLEGAGATSKACGTRNSPRLPIALQPNFPHLALPSGSGSDKCLVDAIPTCTFEIPLPTRPAILYSTGNSEYKAFWTSNAVLLWLSDDSSDHRHRRSTVRQPWALHPMAVYASDGPPGPRRAKMRDPSAPGGDAFLIPGCSAPHMYCPQASQQMPANNITALTISPVTTTHTWWRAQNLEHIMIDTGASFTQISFEQLAAAATRPKAVRSAPHDADNVVRSVVRTLWVFIQNQGPWPPRVRRGG